MVSYIQGIVLIVSIILEFADLKEFKINLTNDCGNSKLFNGAVLENDEILITWFDTCEVNHNNINSTIEKFYGKKFDSEGNEKILETEIDINFPENLRFRSLESLNDGGFGIFTCSVDSQGDKNFFGNTYNNMFKKLKSDVSISKVANSNPSSQQMPILHKLKNGNFLLIIVNIQQLPVMSAKIVTILARLYNKDFKPITDIFEVNQNKYIYDAFVQVVNTDSDGEFSIIWGKQDNTVNKLDHMLRSFDSSGKSKTDEIKLNMDLDSYYWNTIYELNNGNFIYTYAKDGSLFGKIFNSFGSLIKNEFDIYLKKDKDLYFYSGYTIKSLSNGNFLFTSQLPIESDNSRIEIIGKIFDINGKLLKGDFKINTDTSSSNYGQSILTLNDGKFVVYWQSTIQVPDPSNTFTKSQFLGIYSQIFDVIGTPLDPMPLICNEANFKLPSLSKISLILNKNVNTTNIKVHSLPTYGKLIISQNQTIIAVNGTYSPQALEYVNQMQSEFDFFNFSSVDGFNEGQPCRVNLSIFKNIPSCENISKNLSRHENFNINFIDYVSDFQDDVKNLVIGFETYPNCGKIISNGKEIIPNTKTTYKITNLFSYKSENCSVNYSETFNYYAINSYNQTSLPAKVEFLITKPLPQSETFHVFIDKTKDKKFNFSSHVKDELTPEEELKIMVTKSPICGGKLYDGENKEIVLNQLYLASSNFIYKTSSCQKSEDTFSYIVINNDLIKSYERDVQIFLKASPVSKDIQYDVIQAEMFSFKFDKFKISDIEDPFESLKIVFTKCPKIGKMYDSNKTQINQLQEYSVMTEFFYLSESFSDSEDNILYSALNSFELYSQESNLKFKINAKPKWWTTPISICGFIFSGCAALGSFIFTLCKCKSKGYCCWKKKNAINDINTNLLENEHNINLEPSTNLQNNIDNPSV